LPRCWRTEPSTSAGPPVGSPFALSLIVSFLEDLAGSGGFDPA
jgi:hypothetical protein